MVYSNQLQRNTGIMDPLVFSDSITDSYWWYHGYSTCKNNFIVRKDIYPDTTGFTFGGKGVWRLPSIADKLGPLQLVFELSNLTATGDTQPSFVDFVGYEIFERIDLIYSTSELYQLFPEELFERYKRTLTSEQQYSASQLVAGDLTPTERINLATGTQYIVVDLPLPHTRGTSRWLEIMQLAVEPRIEIYFRRLSDIANTTGTNPFATLNNVHLKATFLFVDADERDAITARTESEDGIIRLFDDYKAEWLEIPQGSSGEVSLKLNNFRTSTKRILFFVRHKTDLTTPLAHNYFNLIPIQTWYLEEAGGKIIEPIRSNYNVHYLTPLYHVGLSSDYIYEHTFAISPDDQLNATGSLNLGNTTNLLLKILLPTGTTADTWVVTVMSHEYNTHQHVRGDLVKNFK